LPLLRRRYLADGERRKLTLQDDDNEFFGNSILGEGQSDPQQPSQRRLRKAKDFFTASLSERPLDEIEDLVRRAELAVVLTYSVTDSTEATLIFETVNDRGRPLTQLEKTRSLLMYRTTQASSSPEERLKDLQVRFTGIYRSQDDLDGFKPAIKEDSVLRFHYITHFPWKAHKDEKPYDQPVRNIKAWLDAPQTGTSPPVLDKVDTYSGSLRDGFADMVAVHECGIKNQTKPYLQSVSDLLVLGRMGNFWPLMMTAWRHDRTSDKANVGRVARLLECYSLRGYGIIQFRSNTGDTKLYGLARDFRGNFDQLFAVLKQMLDEYVPDKTFRGYLEGRDLYHRTDTGYLLWKYENHLRQTLSPKADAVSKDEYLADSSTTKLTLEHIVPQNTATQILGEGEAEDLLHSLGNLALLSHSANSALKDFDWKTKKATFEKYPFKALLELDRFVPEGEAWGKSAILERRKAIVDFAIDYSDYRKIS
jgi:hypothetical protein